MAQSFFDKPILNSPYNYPGQHWELIDGQPSGNIIGTRRDSVYYSPVPKPKKVKKTKKGEEQTLKFTDDLTDPQDEQEYVTTKIVNEIRSYVQTWRQIPNPNDWGVTPETARLHQHWRHHKFSNQRPFFCQVEAVETAIWLTEVAPKLGVGCKASLVILEANDPVEAIRLRANRTTVISKGKIVAERPSTRATLHIAGRPSACDRKFSH